MGCYIKVEDADGREVPLRVWDWGLAGGRAIAQLLSELPHDLRMIQEDDALIRPSDIEQARAAEDRLTENPNPGQWGRLMDLLEENPSYWVHVSW